MLNTIALRGTLGIVLALSLFTCTGAMAQKIAVLDTRQVLAQLPEAQVAQQKLQVLQKTWTDSLERMRTRMQTTYETYQKVGDTFSADAKKKAQDDLAAQQDAFNHFRDSKFGQEGELAQTQNTMLKPIFDKITAAIQEYGKKEKYTLVLDKASALYSMEALDITNKFSEYLNAKSK